MTIKLDDVFRAAMALPGTWTLEDVQSVLETLANTTFQIDWEPGDEQWGRILGTNKAQALVCARIPLGIALNDFDVTGVKRAMSWLTVQSMSDEAFEVDQGLLEQIFGRSLSENVDYSKLSISDLWWATAT